MESNYKLKLKALLHDPIHKIWSFENVKEENIFHNDVLNINAKWHEKVAQDLFSFLISENLEDKDIQIADAIASSLSRIIVAPDVEEKEREKFNEISNVFLKNSKYIDPFSGKVYDMGHPESHEEVKCIFKKLENLEFVDQASRAKFFFLFLWRFLPDIFPWIEKHPADSRAPNHSIYDHLVQTSAIASCIYDNNSPAFLLFTIGPVQEFIAKAKKTSDLWAGSFLLSYLTYTGIEIIMNKLGPDHIIFPNLNNQPFVDGWLYEKLKDKNVNIDIFEKWKEKWQKQFNNNDEENPFDDTLTIANIPNRFLAVVPYGMAKALAGDCKKAILDKLNCLIEKIPDNNKNIIKEQVSSYFQIYYVILPWEKEKNTKKSITEIIEVYKKLITDKGFVKVIELIEKYQYYKNTNIGITYSLLVELTERFLAARKNIRDFVNIKFQECKKCKICGEYSVVTKDREDELCGICYIKRKLPEIIQTEFNLKQIVSYPSTSEMATIFYKKALDENFINEFIKKFNEIFNNRLPISVSVPALKNNKLYEIDGQWLMESSYRKNYIKNEFGIDVEDNKLGEIKKFLKDNNINPPVYYAILAMDGDEMGKWISGKKLPAVKNLIHEKLVEALISFWSQESSKNLDLILDSPHPMSPSFHNEFSRRLSCFALNNVRQIVEKNYYGKLIYAGGDDVLAFLPCDKVIDCAKELQKAFKEKVSNNASMSAGVVIVHHKYPLSLALQEVRSAEKLAKEKYGRNACCIKLLKNSGENRVAGFKWDSNNHNISQLNFLNRIIKCYKDDTLSTSFAYQFKNILQELGVSDNEKKGDELKKIIKRELKRIYLHKEKKVDEDKEFFNTMIQVFENWQFSYDEFANMFIIAKFLSKEGRE